MAVALSDSYSLDDSVIASMRERGHAVVRSLASRAEVDRYRPAIEAGVAAVRDAVGPLAERDTYGKAFVQVGNLWQRDDLVREFTYAARFAEVAARLLGVERVRLYHDQALCKEPFGGHTPWHQDQAYWPLDTDRTITMWMPLVDVPAEVGTMTFARGSHRRGALGPWIIGDDSEIGFEQLVEQEQFVLDTHGPLRAGDATFHYGWTLHRAPANPTDLMRSVMTIIWFADGARITPITPSTWIDQQLWLDAAEPGALAAGPLNPVVWPPS